MRILLLRRLLWALPTLLGVMLISFGLQQAAPGDRVNDLLLSRSTGGSTRAEVDDLYRKTQKQLALDRAPFYVSIRAHYQPQTPYDIVPSAYRDHLLQLNKTVRDWSAVATYHQAVDQIIRRSEILPPYINDLQKTSSLTEIKRISSVSAEEIPIDLSLAISSLEASHTRWTYPVLTWHGTHSQIHHWMTHLWDDELRVSRRDGQPVSSILYRALGWTLALTLPTLILAILFSMIIALVQERYRGGWFDRISSPILYAIYAVPLFWLATMAIVFFTTDDYGSWTNIFPSIGMKYWMRNMSGFSLFWAKVQQLILPIIIMTIGSLTYLTRQLRTDLQRQSAQPYVLTAFAKGASKTRVLLRHVLPTSMIPFITILTGAIPRTIVGSIVIEVIYNVPGMGRLLISSIHHADWTVTFSIVLLVGLVTVLSYILADVLYMIFYPQMATQLTQPNS